MFPLSYWKLPVVSFFAILIAMPRGAFAQPQPGDVFREYRWTNAGGDAGGALRVGGKLGYGGGPIELPHDMDLADAVRAEVVAEKLLCHDGTRGLAISVNGHRWLDFPEAEGIPRPQWDYQHHTYPIVDVPLDQLRSGRSNHFRLRVSDEHSWNWPQHLIYGVHFRIYYDGKKKFHPTGRLVSPRRDAQLGAEVVLEADVLRSGRKITRVDFVGNYEGVNLEGDGEYTQWHYHYVRAQLAGHICTATESPWTTTWDTSWIPDQRHPLRLAAWITDVSGLTYMTPAVTGLTFGRGDLHVELCRPFDVPEKWVTRAGQREQKFRITGDLSHAVAARLVWCSWSPGYMEGMYINDQKVFDREGPRYAYYVHRVPLADLGVLRPGVNVLKTGKTPKHNGKTVHGMEVNWPGVMVLIQYRGR